MILLTLFETELSILLHLDGNENISQKTDLLRKELCSVSDKSAKDVVENKALV